MRLTKSSDYSLRVLIYLGVHSDRPASIGEISRSYNVSPHVVAKVVQRLIDDGSVVSVRGRRGGLRLNKTPAAINVGAIVRHTESNWDVVECFNREANTCPIEPVCGLKGALTRAQRAFLGVLDDYTLADFLPRAPTVKRLLRLSLERSMNT
ncbi:MAG: Rrf2 family transcriptional regulator [Acidobacteriota bacterium]